MHSQRLITITTNNYNTIYILQRKFNPETKGWGQIIQFLDEINKSIELIYGYKKINSLLRDIYIFPDEMKIIIGRHAHHVEYDEKRGAWYLKTKYHHFWSVTSTTVRPFQIYVSLKDLLEEIKNKLQVGLNELPVFLPYYKDKKYALRLNMYV